MRNLTIPSRRTRTSCSTLALATVLVVGATPAAAQSFLGSGSFTHNGGGSAAINTAPNLTTISVNPGSTVIDWIPTDNAIGGGSINFQSSGTTANFLGTGNYVVLNRINPADSTRSITMNGTIQTLALGAAAAANGSLYFYTPGGFVIGGNAVINVGSLVLSASPITVDGSGNFINGAANTVTFGQASQAAAQISINSGAQINALNSGSYVAVVAPNIGQNGTITVNGSAALVAAEAATISFSPDGLFDIQVTSGTTSTFGISSGGDIGGSISSGAGDNHRIHLVAVPKNQALTMVIGAGTDLGFNVAGAANVDGNAIVLSAGYDIVDGVAGTVRSAGGGTGNASVNAFNFNATSALTAASTFDVRMGATSGTSTWHSDVTLRAPSEASVISSNAGTLLRIKGDLSISADRTIAAGTSGSAGLAAFYTVDGGSVIAERDVTVTADATGASSTTAGVAGGSATGGRSFVQSQDGGSVSILGDLSQSAMGTGGDALVAGAAGGLGIGGSIQFMTFDTGSTVSVTGSASSIASGEGGTSSQSGVAAGNGVGGTINIGARSINSSLTVGGLLSAYADGQGGNVLAAGVNGGNGTGGSVFINSDSSGASTILNGGAVAYAGGYGGDSGGEGCIPCNGAAGGGLGGSIQFSTSNGGAGTALTVNGDIIAEAEGRGGYGNIAGGLGTGGIVSSTYASSSAITLNGDVDFSAIGYGGGSSDGNGATGQGGRVIYGSQTAATGSLTVTGNASSNVSGYGGSSYTGNGGLGRGGQTDNGGSAGNVAFQADFNGLTNGYGGSSQFGTGGNAIGGSGWVEGFGAAVQIGGDYSMTAAAYGGYGATGGNATGGLALLQATAGSTVTVGGGASVNSDAFGGYTYASNGVGGNATGGIARIQASTGSTVDINGSADISADGEGGDVYSYFGGTGSGGDGVGGTARLVNNGGNLTVGEPLGNSIASVEITADGYGGYAYGGNGGNGTGGVVAEIAAINGDIRIEGYASLSASGFGGDGLTGGNGLGSGDTSNLDQALWTGGAHIFARNGDIVITGSASVYSTGTGGDGGNSFGYSGEYGGDGGDGIGGWATIHSANSNLGPSSISIDIGNLEGSGTAFVNVSGSGGDGGDGASGNAGGDGGNGGIGQGGLGVITAAAGNGTLTIGVASVDATARGGIGGNGGNGDGLPGGNGGDGGNAIGGSINVGTESGSGQSAAVNNGLGDYGSILADSSAVGGDGGDGNFGSVNGAGGNGGNAAGGTSVLLVRGSTVNVDNVTLTADATGGNGGLGDGETSPNGNGGNATVGGDGGIAVLVTERFQIPTQRGTLAAGSINGTAIATAGTGEIDGISQTLGGNLVVFRRSDGALGSLDFLVQADTIGAGAVEDAVAVHPDGTVTVEGAFNFVTSGTLSLLLDNSTLTADTIRWHAADFVPDTVTVTPAVAGTFFANSFDIQTGNNFITTANLDSVQALTIVAPGAIQIGNVTGDANIVLQAQSGEIDIGNILGGAGIDLDANDFVATGNVVGAGLIDVDAGSTIGMGTINNSGNTSLFAGTSINVGAINSGNGAVSLITGTSSIFGDVVSAGSIFADSGSDIFLGNLTAPGDIELVAAGSILIGNATAGQDIDLDAGGYIDGGNMTAGDSVYAEAVEYIDLLNVSAGIVNQSTGYEADYNVGLLAGTTIDTGNIAAFNSIGLGAGGAITTGNIDAGNIFLALGGGNMSFGAIVADGTTYLADDSMIPLGGDLTSGFYDPAPILAAIPTVSGGSITLRSTVDTGRFVAAASGAISGSTINSDSSIYTVSGGNTTLTNLDAGSFVFQRSSGLITEGNLDAGGYIDVRSVGGLALGNLVAGDYIDLRSNGAIGLGNATSGETIYLLSGTSITGGNLTAGDSVLGETNGAIQLGDISAGITAPSTAVGAQYAARFTSGAAITTGDVTASGRIGFGAVTNLTTGDLVTGEGLMALVGGNMTSGAIDADAYVYIGNNSMAALGGAFLTFDRAPILALAPVATGGSIAIGGPVTTGNFEAAAGTTLTGTTINSGNLIYAASGGNMSLGNLSANNDVRLTSGGNIATGRIDSGDDVALVASGSISTLDIFAYDDVSADAGTTITTDDITGNSIDLLAGGDIDTGNLLTQDFFGGEAQLFPGASITVQSNGDINTGSINSLDGVYLAANGAITTGGITADTFIETLSGGSQGLGNLIAGTTIDLDGAGGIVFGAVNTGSLDFSSGGAVTGGNINARTFAVGEAAGAILLGNVTTTMASPIDEFSVGFASGASLTIGNVVGVDEVGLAATGNLTTGNVTAGNLMIALVGGNMTSGSISTAANGRVYLADDSMFLTGGGTLDGEGDFNPAPVLALAPVATGGSITINGPVITGRFQAAAGNNLSARAITASNIEASAVNNATIDGSWRAATVALRSGDIAITANGSIDAGTNGTILLNAVRTDGGALIGDGLTGTGYALSNAEFGRISGGTITIAVGGFGGDADTLIGDLTITGPLAGSNIESSTGGVEFVTLQEDGLALDGTLRIVGDVVATGFGAENYLGFYTQNFELDAATGSISITSSGSALAGILELYASRIHVAEGTLLDQLAANPQFAGYREALNLPASVSRPEGVINAASFDIEFGGNDITGPYTLFVQNMGTTTVPAGFLLNAANISDDGEGEIPAGGIDMAINGQIVTDSGTLTGIAVRDLLVTEFGTAAFAPGSTINGCPLTGSCSAAPPRIDTIVRTDVQINDPSGLGDGLFGNESDIDDGETGDQGDLSSPIEAPVPLFDSRPLAGDGDVDDPVSGAGNPSLMGTSEDGAEQCDDTKDDKCKPAKKGDGK